MQYQLKLLRDAQACAFTPPLAQGFEIGSGFSGSRMLGSEHNDEFYMDEQGEVRTRTNRWAGARGVRGCAGPVAAAGQNLLHIRQRRADAVLSITHG